jgi:hypothetical protein
MRSISKKIAVFCLLLTVWSAAALPFHHHSSSTEAARCSVCVTAHSATPQAVSGQTQSAVVYRIALILDPISAKQRLVSFALRVRPPPAV